jgi:hypothetical protein
MIKDEAIVAAPASLKPTNLKRAIDYPVNGRFDARQA